MRSFWSPVLALLWKDLLLELRTKDVIMSVLVFALLIIIIFNFAIDPTPQMVTIVAPGILWVAVLFGGILGLTRSFTLEKENNSMQTLMLAPVGREILYFGKMLGNFLFMLIVEIIIFPVFAVLFNLPMVMLELVPVALLTTLGIATIGTVFAAMATNTKSREVMLPLLFLPVMVPVLIAAVESSRVAIQGDPAGGLSNWIALLGLFDSLFLLICPLAFRIVIEE